MNGSVFVGGGTGIVSPLHPRTAWCFSTDCGSIVGQYSLMGLPEAGLLSGTTLAPGADCTKFCMHQRVNDSDPPREAQLAAPRISGFLVWTKTRKSTVAES